VKRFTKAQNSLLETYRFGNYIIEICKETDFDGNESFDAYLQRKGYGIKDYMFGVPTETNTLEGFIELVEANIEEYIRFYREEYCNE